LNRPADGHVTILYGMLAILPGLREGRLAMIRQSWAWVSVIVLAVAACGTPPGELSPDEAAVPAPPDGVIVGVVVTGRTPSTSSSYITNDHQAHLSYRQDAGAGDGKVLLVREYYPLPGTVAAMESGLPLIYRPFAMRMPAGQREFVAFGSERTVSESRVEQKSVLVFYKDHNGQVQSKYEWQLVTVYDQFTVTDALPVRLATFEVAPGKVRYIGRFGMIVHAGGPPSAQGCAIGRPERVGVTDKRCFVREFFADSAPQADLAMIRQRFPKLAGAEIEIRPVQFRAGDWQDFARAAGRFGGGP
jgi:hypothetical protein